MHAGVRAYFATSAQLDRLDMLLKAVRERRQRVESQISEGQNSSGGSSHDDKDDGEQEAKIDDEDHQEDSTHRMSMDTLELVLLPRRDDNNEGGEYGVDNSSKDSGGDTNSSDKPNNTNRSSGSYSAIMHEIPPEAFQRRLQCYHELQAESNEQERAGQVRHCVFARTLLRC